MAYTIISGTYRNSKRHFRPVARRRQRPRLAHGACGAPCAPRQSAGGARSTAGSAVWTGATGWARVESLRGALGRRPREGRLGKAGGKISARTPLSPLPGCAPGVMPSPRPWKPGCTTTCSPTCVMTARLTSIRAVCGPRCMPWRWQPWLPMAR